FFMEPRGEFGPIDTRAVIVLITFALTGVFISAACESLLQARDRLAVEKAQSERYATERRTADAKLLKQQRMLQHSEQRFAALTDAMPHLVRTLDAETAASDYVNRNWTEYTGLDLQATNTLGCTHFVHPDDQAQAQEW